MLTNTPTLETKRLVLRRFTPEDIPAIYEIFSDPEVNRFLPWPPVSSMDEAREFYQAHYGQAYQKPAGYYYAICRKGDNVPIGYMGLGVKEPYELGYGPRREFWGMGCASEAGRALLERLTQDGLPYVTATHDVNNPASGRVMQALGMTYRYTYREQWQPKNVSVLFRLYQLDLNGSHETYQGYAEKYPEHFVEDTEKSV